MKKIILLFSLALLALTSSAQTTGTWNKVNARDTFALSGRQLAEIVYVISAASRNNESPTAKAVYDYIATIPIHSADTVLNLAALRAYTSNGRSVWVQSTEGIFFRTASGTENGGTLIAAANGVKWKRAAIGSTYYPEFWEIGGYDETGTAAGITDKTEQIQAAVNVCAGTGGRVVLRKRFSPYNVIGKVTNIATGAPHKGAVELKSNMIFEIEPGCTLRKADAAQTDAGGPVSLLYGDTITNITITGGGAIDGNTAGQTGWTGGYSQVGANGAGIYIAASAASSVGINSNIFISDLEIYDHFSCPIQCRIAQDVEVRNVRYWSVGEGAEFIRCQNVKAYNIFADGEDEVSVGDGFEVATCKQVVVDGITIQNWGSGSSIDMYSTQEAIVTNFTIKNTTVTGGGISAGSASATQYANNIIFSNGHIYNSDVGAISGDGYVRFDNITFDSCAIGVLVGVPTYSPAYTTSVEIRNCAFRNRISDGKGVHIQGRRPVTVKTCSFEQVFTGVTVSGSASNLTPNVTVTGCVFSRLANRGIYFDAQGQGSYAPQALVGGNVFRDNAYPGITLPTRIENILLLGNAIDTMLTLGGSFTEVTTQRIYIIDGSPNTTDVLPKSGEEHIVTLLAPALSLSGSVKTIRHYTTASGNVALANGDAFSFERGATLTLKYSASKNRWYEIGRAHTGAYADSTYTIGERKIFADGWNIENVGLGSQSNIVVYRFNGLNTEDQYFYLPSYGMVRSIGIRSSEAISTGSITAGLWWNGTGPNGTVVLSGGATSNTTTYGRYGKYPAATNTKYHMKFTTSSDFAHPTADISMWIEIEF
jgi:hypothetical protein